MSNTKNQPPKKVFILSFKIAVFLLLEITFSTINKTRI